MIELSYSKRLYHVLLITLNPTTLPQPQPPPCFLFIKFTMNMFNLVACKPCICTCPSCVRKYLFLCRLHTDFFVGRVCKNFCISPVCKVCSAPSVDREYTKIGRHTANTVFFACYVRIYNACLFLQERDGQQKQYPRQWRGQQLTRGRRRRV